MDRKKTRTGPGLDRFATGPPVAVASVLDQAQLQLPGFGDILQPEKDRLRPVETSLYRLYSNQSEPDLWTQIGMLCLLYNLYSSQLSNSILTFESCYACFCAA
jgi:hypothetical protein